MTICAAKGIDAYATLLRESWVKGREEGAKNLKGYDAVVLKFGKERKKY